jgi:protein SCO1/2
MTAAAVTRAAVTRAAVTRAAVTRAAVTRAAVTRQRWRQWVWLLLVLSCSACAAQRSTPLPSGGVEEHEDALVPLDAPFTSSESQPVRLGNVVGHGKPALLVLAYSRCSMLCNLVLQATADLVPKLGLELGKDFSLATVSIDPRETPAEAGRTQALALTRAGHPGDVADWPFLVGDQASIQRVARTLGFRYAWDARTEQFAHPAVIFAISREGRVSGYFYDLRPDPVAVRAALLGARPLPGVRSVGAVLNCFRFDALARKYGPVVQRAFQAGALLVAGGLAFGIVLLFRRERREHRAEKAAR